MADAEHATPVGLTPHIVIRDGRAKEALDFYLEAFGGTNAEQHPEENGDRLMHASIWINGGLLMLNDDFSELQGGKPSP